MKFCIYLRFYIVYKMSKYEIKILKNNHSLFEAVNI